METIPRFSVVVCAYTTERWDDLRAAVASLTAQTHRPEEIVLVCDHNPVLLDRMRCELRDDADIVENRFQRGLSGARNSGIMSSHGQVVAFIDDDAVAREDWLEHLGSSYRDPRVLGVGGSIEPMWLAHAPTWFPDQFKWVVGCTYEGMPLSAAPVRNLLGCNMSFRRSVFQTIGGFRSGLGRIGKNAGGCEETEICIRALNHWPGGMLMYQPIAKVHHRVPNARGTHPYFRARCYAEGLSKASVSHLVGTSRGLSSERAYAARTLPLGMATGLAKAIARRDISEAAKAGAIMLGLAYTSAGFVRGLIAQRTLTTRTTHS